MTAKLLQRLTNDQKDEIEEQIVAIVSGYAGRDVSATEINLRYVGRGTYYLTDPTLDDDLTEDEATAFRFLSGNRQTEWGSHNPISAGRGSGRERGGQCRLSLRERTSFRGAKDDSLRY